MSKYNQISFTNPADHNKMYNYGTQFFYEGDTKNVTSSSDDIFECSRPVIDDNGYYIAAKYATLKEELVSNIISHLSMKQYELTYENALCQYNSQYRKHYYSDMSIESLLVLLVYCNFDKLQFQFTKTYRENLGDHDNFYHMGKWLKFTIHEFGDNISKTGLNNAFYHGISEKLTFPSIISDVQIYGPLSTSISFEAAMIFTNNSQGLIVEFGAARTTVKYMSLAWLSDYPNEAEHLFIQNEGCLEMNDIVDVSNAHHYAQIITSLKAIDKIMQGVEASKVEITSEPFIKKIIQHQVSSKLHQYEKFHSLDLYGQNLITTYFQNKQ
eukprot:73243_1